MQKAWRHVSLGGSGGAKSRGLGQELEVFGRRLDIGSWGHFLDGTFFVFSVCNTNYELQH
jgi:hypothetical protein